MNLVVNIGGTKLDRRRQTLGISPNFVHSCDASHMMLTTCLAAENGIESFAMIHDSYGTHAGQAAILAAALRQAFVDQYSGDVLADFRQQLVEQLPPEAAEKLPPSAAWRPGPQPGAGVALFLCLVHPLWQLIPQARTST